MIQRSFSNKWYSIALALLMAVACSGTSPSESDEGEVDSTMQSGSQADTKGTTTITGTFEGAENKPVFLQLVKLNSMEPLQTATVNAKGKFEFHFSPEKAGFFRIGLNDQDGLFLVVTPGEKISVTAKAGDLFRSFQVKGSPESELMKKMNLITMQRDSIGMVIQQAQNERNQAKFEEAYGKYESVNAKVDKELKEFINANSATFAALACLQNFQPDNELDYFNKVVDALAGKADGNEIYEALKAQVKQLSVLGVGTEAPDFKLPQPNGKELSLSDLRGQYVLIDFWASWCGPCRRENPNVKRVYDKYHSKGFEILGVSLDKTQQAWLLAIEQDQLNWRHVSDLKFWQSSVVPMYQIQGIPLTFLLDKNGKIIAKNLRGQALEAKMAEIFGF